MLAKYLKVNRLLKIFLIVIICFAASGWFRGIFYNSFILGIIFLFNSIVLVFLITDGRIALLRYLTYFLFGLLVVYQFKTTNIINTYSFTPAEIDKQITRMNYYPPSQARLGYILETKREVKIIDKFVNNFIEGVDFRSYFPDYFSFIFLPFAFIGIFWFVKDSLEVKDNTRIISYAVLIALFILSLLGINGKYGPFIFFPFIVLFIYIGIEKLFMKLGIKKIKL